MASTESGANKIHYETIAANAGKLTSPQAVIDFNDTHWTALTGEPRGVDYIEVDAGGVPAMWIAPKGADAQRVLFYAHGGGFVGGSIYTHRKLAGHLAKAIGCRALLYDYPLAHQAKHPAQLEAAMTAWNWLTDEGFDPGRIVIAGDSCGAVLTYGLLQRLRAQGRPLPVATLIISGWFDMALTAASYETNRDKDPAFAKAGVDWLVANSSAMPTGAIPRSARSMPISPAFRLSTCRPAPTRRWSTKAACSPSVPAKPASRRGSMSLTTCCTPSR
ncbi:alpha/beta hydrolase [Mesorhizobium opportunistum]|uniref:Alpha/beta hydrolase n=1 Tax=Mesorhizobium opportunistum TaxID=593909 RepID=A0ABV1YMN5_9HYPH|nr:alpha/beta hydrolase [Mesorhizobium sp.]